MAGEGRHGEGPPRRRSRSLRLGRVAGIEVRLHWTFLAFLALAAWLSSASGLGAVANGLLWLAAVFASVLVHEVAHGLMARRRGVRVVDILLTPIGGLSRLASTPKRPEDELAIALVGPLASFGIALVAALAGLATGSSLWPPSLFGGPWIVRLTWLNVLLGGFNLLPALPMDGGRVLRAALARRRGPRVATHLAAQVARALAIVMIVVGVFYDFWLSLIGFFVLLGAGAEEQEAEEGGGPGGTGGREKGTKSEPPDEETGSDRGLGEAASPGRRR